MKGVEQLFPESVELGEAKLSKYVFDDPLHNVRAMLRDLIGRVSNGKYIRLILNGSLVMSDTDMEKTTNRRFVHDANGNVLIAGLGIGLVLHNIKDKIDSGRIKKVVVIEKSKDVIDLVSPYFPWAEMICTDIFEWATDEKWDTIYFDIWADRCTDNLNEIRKLHNKFKFKLNRNNPNCWMNSWYKEELQAIKRRENNNGWY